MFATAHNAGVALMVICFLVSIGAGLCVVGGSPVPQRSAQTDPDPSENHTAPSGTNTTVTAASAAVMNNQTERSTRLDIRI